MKLIERIPELRVLLTAPSIGDEIRQEFLNTIRRLDQENEAVEVARAPLIERQLQELKPKFDAATKQLSEELRDFYWQGVVA